MLCNIVNDHLLELRNESYKKFYGSLPEIVKNYIESNSNMNINDFYNQRNKHFYVLINPHGGSGKSEKYFINKILPYLTKGNIKCDIELTKYSGHSWELGYKYNPLQYEGVILVGGDGLVNEFLNGLLSKRENKEIILSLTHIFFF